MGQIKYGLNLMGQIKDRSNLNLVGSDLVRSDRPRSGSSSRDGDSRDGYGGKLGGGWWLREGAGR